MKKKVILYVCVFSLLSFLIGCFIGTQIVEKEKKIILCDKLLDKLSQSYVDVSKDFDVSYYHLYIFTLHQDYLAYEYLDKKQYEDAKHAIWYAIRIKRRLPQIWPLHCNESYPIGEDKSELLSSLMENPCSHGIEIVRTFMNQYNYYFNSNNFEKAYITLKECIEFERSQNLGIGPEGPYSSCIQAKDSYINNMLKADCCGFLNLMHSEEIPYEEKKMLIGKLTEMINIQHEKE